MPRNTSDYVNVYLDEMPMPVAYRGADPATTSMSTTSIIDHNRAMTRQRTSSPSASATMRPSTEERSSQYQSSYDRYMNSVEELRAAMRRRRETMRVPVWASLSTPTSESAGNSFVQTNYGDVELRRISARLNPNQPTVLFDDPIMDLDESTWMGTFVEDDEVSL